MKNVGTGEVSHKAVVGYQNPPSPPDVEEVVHDPLDPDFYDDLRAAKLAGGTVTVTYDEGGGNPIKAVSHV